MDRATPTGKQQRELRIPRGVKVRQFTNGCRVQIAFSFRGTECRELVPGEINQSTINYAAGLRAEIIRRIGHGTFQYGDYFPDSPRAGQFDKSGKRIQLRSLLNAQLDAYERQVDNGTLSKSTFEGYSKAIRGERMKAWDGKAIGEITPSMLRDWIGAMGVTPKRARNLLTPLRSVFEDALNDEIITSNPFDRIALNKLLRQTTKSSDYAVDPFSADERMELLRHARADEHPMLAFWLATGLRPGEMIALRWGKIDWVGRKARIDRNQVSGVEKGPKTAAGVRDVELSDAAVAALIAQKTFTFLAGEHVWHNPRTSTAWGTDAQIRKTLWEPLIRRSGLRHRNAYQCRHTYASAMLTAGENPWYVAQQLGHADVQMVFRVYGKFIAADYRRPIAPALRAVAGEP
jgi:integrase